MHLSRKFCDIINMQRSSFIYWKEQAHALGKNKYDKY